MKKFFILSFLVLLSVASVAQAPDEDQLGAWYMYFFNKRFSESSFGIQGDFQYRAWNAGSDMEQLLLRSGATYRPKNTDVLFTLGYAYVSTGAFGENDATTTESRIYQEMLLPQKVGNRFFFTHRFRYEQRWMEDLDFRTRFRYNLFLNVALNNTQLTAKTIYLALYNEIFINGQRSIGNGLTVDYFDRNRTYLGVGYGLTTKLRVQAGWMKQTTASWGKGQMQVSLHHNF